MPRHTDEKLLPYTPDQMFDLVADVRAYPQFLPWVVGSRVVSQSQTLITADLIVGFKVFRESFTSRVTLERPGHIHVDYVKGPLRHLYNDWRFEPAGEGARIGFLVDFEFKNPLFERMVGGLFTEAVKRMVTAFEARAAQLYGVGAPSATSRPSATRTA
ncbi:MAG: type II toxin-antitoxin system RatA family toxin [Sphingomonadales bacterium]|nr:MAG: type II toxin-antitoxin system RatA family toxin [Sphingomonadales bacterium]